MVNRWLIFGFPCWLQWWPMKHYLLDGPSSWHCFPSHFSFWACYYGSELEKSLWFAQKKIAWSASVLSRLKTSVRRHKFSFSLLASCVPDRVYYLTDDWEKRAPATIWPQTEDGFYICYLNCLERKGFGNEVLTFNPCWLRNQLQEYYQKWIYPYRYIYMCVYIIYA